MTRALTRKVGSRALATIDRLATHLALLADAKAQIAGVNLDVEVLKPGVRRSLQRALAYPPDRHEKSGPARRRR
jgi:hypothetical protein